MKKYTGLLAYLALFLALQAPSIARPDDFNHNRGPKPPEHHQHRPPHHRGPHMQINYRYPSPCYRHHRSDCLECCNRPPREFYDGFFGSRIGFTIFL